MESSRQIRWVADGPGSFLRPTGVTTVRDRQGIIWRLNPSLKTRWNKDGSNWIRWRVLVENHGPLVLHQDSEGEEA